MTVLAALVFAASLAGCTTGDAPAGSTASAAETKAPQSASGSFTAADLDFLYNGKAFKLGGAESALFGLIGEADSVDEAVSCLFDGFDKTYHYGFCDVFTFPAEDGSGNIVDEIYITGDAYLAKDGVKTGSSKSDVEKAYGMAYYMDGDTVMVYNAENDSSKNELLPKLYFVLDGDTVTGIGYCANLYHVA